MSTILVYAALKCRGLVILVSRRLVSKLVTSYIVKCIQGSTTSILTGILVTGILVASSILIASILALYTSTGLAFEICITYFIISIARRIMSTILVYTALKCRRLIILVSRRLVSKLVTSYIVK